jgi:glycosyltransferase involved in cell wall biosynthesis
VILGRGALEAETRALAAQLGIADRVKFPGFVANPWAWMAKAKLFALSSRWEGFPSVVAEALACGAPALVTACDFGPAEVVEDGTSGWVAPVDNVEAFGAALDHLIGNDALRAEFARAGRIRAEEFDIDPMVDAYTSLFIEQALAARPVTFGIGTPEPAAVGAYGVAAE